MYLILNKDNQYLTKTNKGYSFTNTLGFGCRFETERDADIIRREVEPLNWLNLKIVKKEYIKDLTRCRR